MAVMKFGDDSPIYTKGVTDDNEVEVFDVERLKLMEQSQGNLSNLQTATKSNLVGAVNDVTAQLATKEKQIEILTNNKFRMTFRNDQLGVNIQNPTELSVLQSKFVKMKEIGIHNIILCPQVNMLTYQSNDFTEDTISYEQIKTNAETCIAAGFNVYLKLHVECKDGTWRANIAPTDINTFFTNYKNFILKYAQLSEELGLKFFCIGEEMMSISGSNYSDKWSDIINSIRTIYNGKLTYGANLIVWDDEHRRNIIYDLVDYLGIDLWAQAASGANPSNLNIYQQINGWLIPTFEELYATYGKKIIFTEIGYFPTAYGAEQPGNTSQPNWTIDYQQQANVYNMIFSNFIGQDWFQDLWYWAEKNTSFSNPNGNLDRYSVLIDDNVATQNIFKKFKEV